MKIAGNWFRVLMQLPTYLELKIVNKERILNVYLEIWLMNNANPCDKCQICLSILYFIPKTLYLLQLSTNLWK